MILILELKHINSQHSYYDANGTKFRRSERTKHITTVIKVDSKGDTTYVERVGYKTDTRDYYGDLIKENGVTKKIYNESGYLEINKGSTATYHYYVKDYLGSIRAVVDQNGNLEQSNDYYPCGLPTSDYSTSSSNDLLHNSKEFSSFSGLYMYDNEARNRDPLFNRFTSIDPMAEKYPEFSPYAVCGNNPLMIVDPSGKYWDNPEEAAQLERETDQRKKELEEQRRKIQEKLGKEGLDEKSKKGLEMDVKEIDFKMNLLNKGIDNIKKIGNDTENRYAFNWIGTDQNSSVTKGFSDGKIYINATTAGVALHEITHIGQSLDAGDLNFSEEGMLLNASKNIINITNNEVDAYRTQFSFDGSFPGSQNINRVYEINVHTVGRLNIGGTPTYPKIRDYSDYLRGIKKLFKKRSMI